MNQLKTLGLVIILAAVGLLLLPYIKLQPKSNTTEPKQIENQGTISSKIETVTSSMLGISFKYDPDQDGDGKVDTATKEIGDKSYVYYMAAPVEQGQWIQKFEKNPQDDLKTAITKQFLKDYKPSDCYAQTFGEYYESFGVDAPEVQNNVEKAVIAYPKPADESTPYWQNASKCPPIYSATNGVSYFLMDKAHPEKYYFISIGQYAIFADMKSQTTWESTLSIQ